MKTNILKTVTISLGLLSAQALLAQTDNQISQQATYYELPTATANCDNSAESLNCHLMMNPAIEEGAKAAEEAVSARSSRNFFKEREAALKASGAAKTGIATPNQSASTVFSLKQPVFAVQVQVSKPISIVVQPSVASTASTEASFVATEEISKSTTPISQHFSAMAGTSSSSIEDSESTQEGAQEATTIEFLENEVCNNIYTKCLAKVVTMTLNQTGQAKNALGETAQAVAEWEDAKVLAAAELRIAKRALTKAKEESVAFKEAKDEAFNTPQTGYANAVYQLNKLKEQLVEAKVATACATRTAIEVRNNSNRTTCEERLEGAKKTEAHAFAIYHEAQGKFNKGDISFTQTSSHASNIGDKIFGPNIVIKPPQYGTMQDIRNSHTDQEIENFLLEKEALKETEKKFVAEREKINIEKAVLAEKAEALAKDRKDLEAERRTSASIASTQIKQTLDEKINALIDKQTALVQERAALDQKDLELKTLEKSLNKTQDDLGKREKELLAKEKAFEQESNAARQAIERDRNKLAQERNGISAKENTLKTSQEILAKEIVDLEIQRKALAQQQKALEESQKTASVKDKQTLDSQIAALVNQQKKLATQDVDLKKQVADLITQKTALDHIKTTLDQKEANLKFREKELVDAKDAIARATADLETRQKTLEKTWNKKETDALKAQQTAYQTLQAAEAAKKQAEKIAAQHAISAQDANAYAEQANLDKEAALKAQQEAES
ncbi:MAG TPA: hypothetical protein VJK54_05255, partial [Chthoniobacterales bacterium]|nr:hypothetical protein [Chthoniobacterales bacterium]